MPVKIINFNEYISNAVLIVISLLYIHYELELIEIEEEYFISILLFILSSPFDWLLCKFINFLCKKENFKIKFLLMNRKIIIE